MREGCKGRTYRRSFSVALALLLYLGVAPAGAAELYGLVVGIDDYLLPVNHLDGAVNDAQDIAQSLEHAGAKEVVRLLNDDARKDRIVSEWQRILAEAKPGDTFVFSYAGHGGQEPTSRVSCSVISSQTDLGHASASLTMKFSFGFSRPTRKASRSFLSPIPATVEEWSAARARLA
jgi:hypothetical protein